jgi:hypothetical protein
VHAELGCDLKERQPTRLDTLRILPLELIRKMPALLLLHRTLLCRSKDLSRVPTQAEQDQPAFGMSLILQAQARFDVMRRESRRSSGILCP